MLMFVERSIDKQIFIGLLPGVINVSLLYSRFVPGNGASRKIKILNEVRRLIRTRPSGDDTQFD